MKVSVCIPMYNESSVCREAAEALYREMTELREKTGIEYEVIFSNDGSTDNCTELTAAKARELDSERIKIIGYSDNRGKGSAVREAVLASDGDVVLYTDCDLAYGTKVIGEALSYVEDGADMVIGSRNLSPDGYEGYSLLRKIASRLYIKVIAVAAGFKLSDSQCGFKCFKGDSARRIFSLCTMNGFSFDLEVIKIAQKLNMTIREMPIKIINHKKSKVNVVKDAVRMLSDLRKIKKRVKSL